MKTMTTIDEHSAEVPPEEQWRFGSETEMDIAGSYMYHNGVDAQEASEAIADMTAENRHRLLQIHPDPRVSRSTSGEMFDGASD